MKSLIRKELNHHIDVFSQLSLIEEEIILLYNYFETAINNNKKILIFGNGGSAADAQHFAAELVVKFEKIRKPIRAIALTTDTSIITATGNDFSFNEIFSRQIQAIVDKNDLAVGISTSGFSTNVLNGLQDAKNLDAKTLLLTGSTKVDKNFIDFEFNVPTKTTSRIQEIHLFTYHILCKLFDKYQS